MSHFRQLLSELHRIDGKGYKAYKDIKGKYNYPEGTLYVDHVQGDPFAAPSHLRFRLHQSAAGFPGDLYSNKIRTIALEDYLTRMFDRECNKRKKSLGTGKSGMMNIDAGNQEVLERTAMVVNSQYVEARFVVGLPARGRRILGKAAIQIFKDILPHIIQNSMYFSALNKELVEEHVDVVEDQDFLRRWVADNDGIAFVGDDSILPRVSGIDDRPMKSGKVVPFQSPETLRQEVQLPHRGNVSGMFIKKGVTLIVGGGYHGKSTLLNAVELGVYNHIPGDGRELVVSLPDAVKIRSEDGRRVEKVNISPFISNLPYGADTRQFSSEDASGSTSQAANIMEALEVGSSVLLVDEDTSATNFMIRDERMQTLVAKDKEPITPFIDKVRTLHSDLGVSTMLVVGGSGDYFDVADTVIMMDHYRPYDVTDRAKKIASQFQTTRRKEGGEAFGKITPRKPIRKGLNPVKGKKRKVNARGLHIIQYGRQNISLHSVEQLVDVSQTSAIGDALTYICDNYATGRLTLEEIIDRVMTDIGQKGLDVLGFTGQHPGEYAMFRPYELAAALNRLRSLHVL